MKGQGVPTEDTGETVEIKQLWEHTRVHDFGDVGVCCV